MLAFTWRGAQEHCHASLREVSHLVQSLASDCDSIITREAIALVWYNILQRDAGKERLAITYHQAFHYYQCLHMPLLSPQALHVDRHVA